MYQSGIELEGYEEHELAESAVEVIKKRRGNTQAFASVWIPRNALVSPIKVKVVGYLNVAAFLDFVPQNAFKFHEAVARDLGIETSIPIDERSLENQFHRLIGAEARGPPELALDK